MNIHQNSKNIAGLLLERKETKLRKHTKKEYQASKYYSGVYIISRTQKNEAFKLGMSLNLYDRIVKQYKICYPKRTSEFFLRYVFLCHRKEENGKSYAYLLEQYLLKESIKSPVEDSYSKEYIFAPNISDLEKKMIKGLRERKKYFSNCIKFVEKGFYLFDVEKGFNTELMDFKKLPSFNPTVTSMLDLKNPTTMSMNKLANAAENERLDKKVRPVRAKRKPLKLRD